MSLPIIKFKATNTDLSASLQDVVHKKFQSFEKFIGDETDVKCEVEFEKVTHSQRGNVHRVEANIWLAGEMYRADATEESFEKAIDEVRAELEKELRRAHKKHDSLVKRGGRKIKEMLKFGK